MGHKDLTTQHEFAKERARRREAKRQTDERCGTVAGYLAHGRKKPRERACKACRTAWANYYREYRRKKA